MSLIQELTIERQSLNVLSFIESQYPSEKVNVGFLYENYVRINKFRFSYRTFYRVLQELDQRGYICLEVEFNKLVKGRTTYIKFIRKAEHEDMIM